MLARSGKKTQIDGVNVSLRRVFAQSGAYCGTTDINVYPETSCRTKAALSARCGVRRLEEGTEIVSAFHLCMLMC